MDGEGYSLSLIHILEGRFGKGAFILNEGNMGNETGTLTFVDSKGIAVDSGDLTVGVDSAPIADGDAFQIVLTTY